MGSIPGLAQWVKDLVLPRGVGRRFDLDPTWLWLWYRPAALALIRPLAWELSYAEGAALKKKKDKKKNSPCGENSGSTLNNSPVCYTAVLTG